MVNIIFQEDKTEDEASKLCGREWLKFPDIWFKKLSYNCDLNKDPFFRECLLEVDRCDIPMDNVIRDIITGKTHSVDKISTGVKMLWLMKNYSDKFLFPSQYLGENCYALAYKIGNDVELYIYDDSDMFVHDEADIEGYVLRDVVLNQDIVLGNGKAFDYILDWK